MIRVVVIEDRAAVRRGIVQCVDAEPEVTVVGEAGSVAEAQALAGEGGPVFDVALVDLGLPDGRGHDVIRAFRTARPEARCMVLTLLDEPEELFEALAVGARGYLLKESSPRAIVQGIVDVAAGGTPITPRMASFIVARLTGGATVAGDEQVSLTRREREVLDVLANGLTYAEAAQTLAIGVGTVQTHVKSIYRKLEVQSKAEAVAEGVRQGLVSL